MAKRVCRLSAECESLRPLRSLLAPFLVRSKIALRAATAVDPKWPAPSKTLLKLSSTLPGHDLWRDGVCDRGMPNFIAPLPARNTETQVSARGQKYSDPSIGHGHWRNGIWEIAGAIVSRPFRRGAVNFDFPPGAEFQALGGQGLSALPGAGRAVFSRPVRRPQRGPEI